MIVIFQAIYLLGKYIYDNFSKRNEVEVKKDETEKIKEKPCANRLYNNYCKRKILDDVLYYIHKYYEDNDGMPGESPLKKCLRFSSSFYVTGGCLKQILENGDYIVADRKDGSYDLIPAVAISLPEGPPKFQEDFDDSYEDGFSVGYGSSSDDEGLEYESHIRRPNHNNSVLRDYNRRHDHTGILAGLMEANDPGLYHKDGTPIQTRVTDTITCDSA